jgi:hypothetical protein
MSSDKAIENYYRRLAKRLNLILEKSRARNWGIDNKQGWRIKDPKGNVIIAGHKWDLSIEEAAQVLKDIYDMAKSA